MNKPSLPLSLLLKNFLLRHKRSVFFIQVILILCAIFVFIFLGAVFSLIIILDRDLPSLEPLEEYADTEKWSYPTSVFDVHGDLICQYSQEKRSIVLYNDIPDTLIRAFISVEDRRFHSHRGIDFHGIVRAAFKDLLASVSATIKNRTPTIKMVEGASTITQQLAKNLFLTQEKHVKRKFKEMLLSYRIEKRYHKNEILERYLNKIYLGTGKGKGVYGIQAAAKAYFDKDVTDLTVAECAILAGLPKRPNTYSPIQHPDDARLRQKTVLKLMALNKIIPEDSIDTIVSNFWLSYHKPPDMEDTVVLLSDPRQTHYPYISEYLRPMLENILGENLLYRGGYKVYTTFDLSHQDAALTAVNRGLTKFNLFALQNWSKIHKSEATPLRPIPAEAALISIDYHTGEIKAMVGGSGFHTYNQMNRAYQTVRQPGSGFKPFIYLAAIDSLKFTAASLINDAPVVFKTPDGLWIPENYGKRFFGQATLRFMLAHSVNVASVRLFGMLSDDDVSDKLKESIVGSKVIEYARSMGITSPLSPYWSLVLGTFPVSPLEMASSYGVIANGGVLIKPYSIQRIENRDGEIVYEHIPIEKQSIKKDSAYILTNLLRGVVENGTGRSIKNIVKRPAAGKTGTTDNFTDAWFTGFTPEITCSVWVGYDSGGISLGPRQTGGSVAGPIWAEYVQEATKDLPPSDFPVPENIVFREIDSRTGLLATPLCRDVIREAFIRGTEPTDKCYYNHDELYHKTVELSADDVSGLLNTLENRSSDELGLQSSEPPPLVNPGNENKIFNPLEGKFESED